MTAGRFISSLGDGLAMVAFPLLAASLTRNPVLIAGVVFATTFPWLIFGLAAGALVDRISRRKVLIGVEVARTAVLLLLAVAIVSHEIHLAQVYAAAFLITAFETLFDSATMAVIPQVAGDTDLVRANSRLQVAQLAGGQFIGPALGGLAFAAAAQIPVLADSASFAASAALIAMALRPARRWGKHSRARQDEFELVEPEHTAHRPSIFKDIAVGLSWLSREPRLRLVALLIPCFAFSQVLGLGIQVIYCTRVLHLSGAAFGLFVAVTSSGNAIGAWLAPRIHNRLTAGRALRLAGATGGLALLTVGLTSSTGTAVVALWVEAVAVGVGTVTQIALRQRLVPLELAGRVSSAMRTGSLGAASVATLLGGVAVALIGPHAPFVIGGAAQLAIAVLLGSALVRTLGDADVVDLRDEVDLTTTTPSVDVN
jgi:MFS family permease